MLDILVNYFMKKSGFNYIEDMKLNHFKMMYKKFQGLKLFDL